MFYVDCILIKLGRKMRSIKKKKEKDQIVKSTKLGWFRREGSIKAFKE